MRSRSGSEELPAPADATHDGQAPWATQAGRGSILTRVSRGEPVADAEFDLLYPRPVRPLSERFWSPIDVARRAAELLVVRPGTRVLDVGSGAGKFCVVGALTS